MVCFFFCSVPQKAHLVLDNDIYVWFRLTASFMRYSRDCIDRVCHFVHVFFIYLLFVLRG